MESEEPGLPSLHPDDGEEGMEADRQEPWDFAAFAAKVRQAETYGRWMFLLDQHEKTGEYSPVRDSRQWQEFLQEAEAVLPGHQEALCRKYPALTIRDLFCCYLYMLDFSDETVRFFDKPLAPGDKVRVIKGPLTNLEGELIHVDGKSQILVRIQQLGSASVDIPAGYVEKI